MGAEYKSYICDQCGDSFEAPATRVYESSDIVFCRKKCYIQYLDEWGDEASAELMDALPGGWDNE
jgi:hypothetical protein